MHLIVIMQQHVLSPRLVSMDVAQQVVQQQDILAIIVALHVVRVEHLVHPIVTIPQPVPSLRLVSMDVVQQVVLH